MAAHVASLLLNWDSDTFIFRQRTTKNKPAKESLFDWIQISLNFTYRGNDQEIKFQEIKIDVFSGARKSDQEIETTVKCSGDQKSHFES